MTFDERLQRVVTEMRNHGSSIVHETVATAFEAFRAKYAGDPVVGKILLNEIIEILSDDQDPA